MSIYVGMISCTYRTLSMLYIDVHIYVEKRFSLNESQQHRIS